MRGRSILLLGGSRQQLVAIEKAHELGYRTVLCDYLPDNPGRLLADSFHLVSTTDREAVLAVARSEGVSGVLAYASGPAAPTAAYVAEQLGLPGNPLSAVETLSEKHLFRAFLSDHGLPCPRSISFPSDVGSDRADRLLSGLRWPVVVKPTDSSGSKGVTVVRRLGDLGPAIDAARAFSRNGTLIAEEYIERSFPRVVGGDVFVVGGEVRFWGIMSCLRDPGSLLPAGEVAPSGLPPVQFSAVKRLLSELVGELGLRFGELNVEVIIGEDGVPYVLELGARAGGNMIPVQLSDASGIDLVSANVLCAMGERPGDLAWESDRDCRECFATYVPHVFERGVFSSLRLSPELERAAYRLVMYTKQGDPVSPFDGANKALGILFLRTDERREMEGLVERISSLVTVELEKGVGK